MELADVGSIATAIGVAFAGWQVAAQRVQSRTTFQDGLWREQRETIARLPIDLVLMSPGATGFRPAMLTDSDRGALYRYFDLANEQAMFARLGRVGPNTWYSWRDSITHHMRRPAFAHAWGSLGSLRAREEFPYLAAVLDGSHRLPRRRDPLGRRRRP